MFYICRSRFTEPLPVSEQLLERELHPAHVKFVADGVKTGIIVFGGPQTGGKGGVLLLRAPDMTACNEFLASDPLVSSGVQSFEVTEFQIFEHAACLDPLL
jgi:uncharacterized protein YciI